MRNEITRLLSGHPWLPAMAYFDTIDSTNTYAKGLAAQGAPEGTFILADTQTGGRGRMGRSFSSPKNMGVYLSVILRPRCSPAELMHLTCATALSSCEAIKSACGREPRIKWTNDLVLGKRKLGGILTELSIDHKTGIVDWIIVGIGINCCQKLEDFPLEIRQIACSLSIHPEERAALAAALIKEIHCMSQVLLSQKPQIMAAYRQKCVTLGQDISVLQGDRVRHGRAVSIDDDGGLLVAFADGTAETVASGEVSIRGMYGYL